MNESRTEPGAPHTGNAIVLYDGVCTLCNASVRFLLRRDRAALFLFAPLQGAWARALLQKHGQQWDILDTIYLLLDAGTPHERLLARSQAILEAVGRLGWPWRWVARIFLSVPRCCRDWAYNVVVRHRYRIFGRYTECPVPSPEERSRFI